MGARHAAVAALAAVLAVSPSGARAEPTEAELKAELVERFTRFVDWDAGDLPSDGLAICVVGESALTQPLGRLVRSRKVKDRKAVVRAVDAAGAADCHLVLIGGLDKKRLAAVIARTEGRPILTIADAPGGAAAGAIINFYIDGKKVRFEVNVRAARDSGLKVRAKLLQNARVVGGKA